MTNPTCPKCDSQMDEGFIVDNTYGERLQSQWVEGKPQRSFWTGVKLAKDAKHPVATFRCEKCGYLESYAPVE
jgi:Domain of unknown function (DUF6487)